MLRHSMEEFAVLLIVGPGCIPLALAGMLQASAMVGDMENLQP
jgi:hypothetical protein